MKINKELLQKTFWNILFTAIYVFGVSQIVQNGDRIFGQEDNMLSPFVFLLLFSLSAAVVGGLVLGRSVLLFLDNKRRESLIAAVYSIGWLAVFTVISLIVLIII